MLSEEGRHLRYIEDVHHCIRRIRGNVLTTWGRRHRDCKIVGQVNDVEYVRETVVINVSRPGVDAASERRVRADGRLGAVAPAVAIGVTAGCSLSA